MHCSSRSVVRFLGSAIAAALVLTLGGCATGESDGPSGPSGPTVKVVFDAQPTAVIIINNTDLGPTPVTANLEVDEAGFLMYNVRIDYDFSKADGGRNAPATKTVNWRVGKLPVAKVMYISGNVTESMEKAPPNPPGTKRSAERYD